MKPASRLEKISFWFYAAGLFTVTWDLLLKVEIGGFHDKIYQPLFLLGFLALAAARIPGDGIAAFFAPLRNPFTVAMLALAVYYLGTSPWSTFPLKSFLYSCWLLFQIFAVWLSTQHLVRVFPLERIRNVLWAEMLFLSTIILVDSVSYHLGRRQGVIGYNQDFYTNLGVSRAHGFTSEPSFAATFLCLGLLTVAIPLVLASRRRWLTGFGAALAVLAMISTASRTGWIGLAFGGALYFLLPILNGRRVQWKPLLGIAIGAPLLVAVFYAVTPAAQLNVLQEKFIGSIVHGTDSSGNSRLQAHVLAYRQAVETHGIGSGLGASYKYYRDHGGFDYSQQLAWGARYFGSELVMSTWGQLLAEGGVAGVLLFLCAAVAMVRSLYRRWRGDNALATLGSLSASIVFFVFIAFFLGNVSRGDIWIWYAVWSAQAL
ncbi:MAG: O-antigen ligase family protein [Bdellovibrionota bacterium]